MFVQYGQSSQVAGELLDGSMRETAKGRGSLVNVDGPVRQGTQAESKKAAQVMDGGQIEDQHLVEAAPQRRIEQPRMVRGSQQQTGPR